MANNNAQKTQGKTVATAPTTRTCTAQQVIITPMQVLAWCKAQQINCPLTQAQLKQIAKKVVYFNSATNIHYTGHACVGSNIAHYKNYTTGALGRWFIGKKPAWVSAKKGMHPTQARKLGYFTYHSVIAFGKVATNKGNKRNNAICIASCGKAHATAQALLPLVAKMPASHLLPACGTWG